VGPSSTLASMVQKTLAAEYESFDIAHNLQRQVLSVKSDSNEIYYTYEPPQADNSPEEQALQSQEGELLNIAPLSVEPSPIIQQNVQVLSHSSGEPIKDTPITAAEIIKSIVAVDMKKSLDEIASSSSIKQLSAGKMTPCIPFSSSDTEATTQGDRLCKMRSLAISAKSSIHCLIAQKKCR
jgi:fatty acid synthase subunit alpha, fungi type